MGGGSRSRSRSRASRTDPIGDTTTIEDDDEEEPVSTNTLSLVYPLYNYIAITTMSSTPDLEAGETTPLVGSDEPPPLQDMKAESLKEKSVLAVGGVSCKWVNGTTGCLDLMGIVFVSWSFHTHLSAIFF